MPQNYKDVMRRAMRMPSAQKLTQVSRVIQDALSAAGLSPPADPPAKSGKPGAGDLKSEAARRSFESLRPEPPQPGRRPAKDTQQTGGARPRPKRALGDVVDILRRAGAARHAARPATAAPPIPEGAQFLSRAFRTAAGSRTYKLYVPASLKGSPVGLVVMLHGCTQDPDDFAVGTGMNRLAEENRLLVLYPAQSRTANQSSCWNWFDPKDQERERGEPSIIAGMTREVAAEFGVAPGRIFAAGLSAGGAMAVILGETYPDLFSAVGVHSGLPYKAATDVPSAFQVMRGEHGAPLRRAAGRKAPRTIVFQGDQDQTVHFSNADRIVGAAGSPAAAAQPTPKKGRAGNRGYLRRTTLDTSGRRLVDYWVIEGAGHAWSGGDAAGSYADPSGPNASREMIDFFLEGLREPAI